MSSVMNIVQRGRRSVWSHGISSRCGVRWGRLAWASLRWRLADHPLPALPDRLLQRAVACCSTRFCGRGSRRVVPYRGGRESDNRPAPDRQTVRSAIKRHFLRRCALRVRCSVDGVGGDRTSGRRTPSPTVIARRLGVEPRRINACSWLPAAKPTRTRGRADQAGREVRRAR